jgi:hypothetical protein
MKRLTVALPYAGEGVEILSEFFLRHPLVDRLLWLSQADVSKQHERRGAIRTIKLKEFYSASAIVDLLAHWQSDYLLIVLPGGRIELGARALERLIQVADDSGAGMIYSDFIEKKGADIIDRPLIECQIGSIRDNFDFGSLLLISRRAADRALEKRGNIPADVRWGGLYDLRLKISIDSEIVRIPEPLYMRTALERRDGGEQIFDYVDPRNREYQVEMEKLATEHLKRIGAWLEPVFAQVPESHDQFPVRASVIIPVRNRVKTISDAVKSALAQTTSFNFNVLVVDNHSSDGTTALLRELAAESRRLIHLIPARTDFGIGGCWNEAIYSRDCGRYAVQLDSDDIYRDDKTLGRIVAELEVGRFAMVIGSYNLVDFDLNELPPGLVDHREWTRDNGRNNALRINGLGAPRAFDVNLLRQIGLPNTSYGEDYAVALRISREYEIGRIYDSLYFARRWSGNSDSALPLVTINRYDTYKDRLRTIEIRARQQLNANKKGQDR